MRPAGTAGRADPQEDKLTRKKILKLVIYCQCSWNLMMVSLAPVHEGLAEVASSHSVLSLFFVYLSLLFVRFLLLLFSPLLIECR
jgi:hypothetical protein